MFLLNTMKIVQSVHVQGQPEHLASTPSSNLTSNQRQNDILTKALCRCLAKLYDSYLSAPVQNIIHDDKVSLEHLHVEHLASSEQSRICNLPAFKHFHP